MHYLDDAKYRIRLAEGFLKEAEQDFGLGRWRSCVDNSQLSVENAGKSVIASFAPVERSHAPALQLKKIAEGKNISIEISHVIKELVPLVGELGAEEHFLSDYGDENSGKDPWELFKETDAQKALAIASTSFEKAGQILKKLHSN